MNLTGKIYRISIAPERGMKKTNITSVRLKENYGIVGDAHAGSERQISILPYESFAKLKNDLIDIKPGDFAENITTTGLDFKIIKIGKKLKMGESIEVEITHIGKECHNGCYIMETVGDCIMPKEGIFAKVISGGILNVGDKAYWSD